MRRISPAEPVSLLWRVPIRENGEPLVSYEGVSKRLIIDSPRYDYRRETLARRTVVEALAQAADRLPKGFMLAVVEGWRPLHIQKRMHMSVWNRFKEKHPTWSDVQLKRVVNRYTAPLDSRVPPPHSTGGAVDVVLTDAEGKRLDVNAPFETYDPKAYSLNSPGLDPISIERRGILAEALSSTVLTNYPSEWWHWTYGDQGWAYRGGHPYALYGPIVPENYQPDPRDVVEEPLLRFP